MVQFEIYINSVENSSKIIRCSENANDINNTIFDALTCGSYDNYVSFETAVDIASWAELATIGEDYITNEITVTCQEV